MKKIVILASCTLLFCIFNGCLNDIDEVPLEVGGEAAAPTGLLAQVDDGKILLAWMPAQGAETYRVYRAAGETIDPIRIAETADSFFIDTGVTNEQQYMYSVSSVDEHGMEGDRSYAVSAIPAVYSVMIDGGEEYTGSRAVTLKLTAPVTTILMRISNSPSIDGGIWETFQTDRGWSLEDGHGMKYVYVIFRDGNGSESPVLSAAIFLDTYANIQGISITPEPHTYDPGATVHLRMNVEDDETSGRAWIEFEGEGYATQVMLYDNGRGGDTVPSDGIYEADFTFPGSLKGVELTAVGGFTDHVGNEAQTFEFDDSISITNPQH